MVKFRDIVPGSVVLLGRLNGSRSDLSNSVGFVVDKLSTKINNSTWTGIKVQVDENREEIVAFHNVKEILA